MKNRIAVAVAVFGVAGAAIADPVSFFGIDAGVGPGGARPNSDGARASWATAASGLGSGSVSVLDFEGLANGFTAGAADAHTTISQSGLLVGGGVISDLGSSTLGYNTTSGGSKHYNGFGDHSSVLTITFDYAPDIHAWGAYLTGIGTVNGVTFDLLFNNGSSQSISIWGASSGGVMWIGFTSIVSVDKVTIKEVIGSYGRDVYSIDDVGYVLSDNNPVIPLPTGAAMAMVGMGVIGVRRRRS